MHQFSQELHFWSEYYEVRHLWGAGMNVQERGNCVDAPQSPPTQLVSLNLQNFALLQRTVGSLTNRASVSKRPLNAVGKFFREKKRRLTFQVVGKPAKPIQSRNSSSLFLGQKSDTYCAAFMDFCEGAGETTDL